MTNRDRAQLYVNEFAMVFDIGSRAARDWLIEKFEKTLNQAEQRGAHGVEVRTSGDAPAAHRSN